MCACVHECTECVCVVCTVYAVWTVRMYVVLVVLRLTIYVYFDPSNIATNITALMSRLCSWAVRSQYPSRKEIYIRRHVCIFEY